MEVAVGAQWKEDVLMLDDFFKAGNVAVIGVSRNPKKIGHVIFRNFMNPKFKGKVYPVNPNAQDVLGEKCYKNVTDVPGKVDLAVIVVPAAGVADSLKECGKKGIKAAIIISGGFGEVGNRGLEDEVKKIAQKYNIRIIGPNCIGVYDAHSLVDTLFLPHYRLERPREGSISFITQSGAVGSAIMDWAGSRGFGVAKFISYGNAADVNETELVKYLGEDPATKVIIMYIEAIKDGRKFMEVAKKVTQKKPVIAIKSGRTSEGVTAIISHTGSLAGSDEVYTAAFNQCGVIRAYSIEEAFDFARVLVEQPTAKGNRIAVVTNGGGYGIMATDAIIEEGLKLAKLSDKTINAIKGHKDIVPPYAVIKNPMDLIGDATAERYHIALDALVNDEGVDAILCIVLMQTVGVESEIVDVIDEISDRRKKPIVVSATGGDYTALHMKMLEKEDVPTFFTPEKAAKALKSLVAYGHILKSK
jgi:acetyl coenzyme A synthetase (ADP forming)-like protein